MALIDQPDAEHPVAFGPSAEPTAAVSTALPPDVGRVPGVVETGPDGRLTARQMILDFLTDSEGPQHVTQIMAGTALSRNAVDSTISRMVTAGLVERAGQKGAATYRLAPPKSAQEPAPTPTETPRTNGVTSAQWLEWLWSWHRGEAWAGPGNPPDLIRGIMAEGCLVPLDCWMRYRGERDAIAKQKAEDDALREQLLAAANGNVVRTAALADLRPIRILHRLRASGSPIRNRSHSPRSAIKTGMRSARPSAGETCPGQDGSVLRLAILVVVSPRPS